MKYFYLKLVLIITIFNSCSSYSKLSKQNKFATDDGFVVYSNETLNMRSVTLGDFKFASTSKEFRRMNKQRPLFKNILLYAKTITHPEYEYYQLLNASHINNPGFVFRATTIDKNKIMLAISKHAPQQDIELIASKIAELKSTTFYNTA